MTSVCAVIQRVFKILAASFLGLFFTGLTLAFFGRSFSRMHPHGSAAIGTTDSELKDMTFALKQYNLLGGSFPSNAQGLQALIEKPTSDPIPKRWVQGLEEVPVDPWGTPYRYHFPGIQNPEEPEIISAGPDGKFETSDDLSNQD